MQLWHEFVATQEKELGKETVERWLRSLVIKKFDACNVYLEAQNTFQTLWFEEHIRPRLRTFVNNNHKPIKVHLLLPGTLKIAPKKEQKKSDLPTFPFLFEELDATCTFDSFVTTAENVISFKVVQEAVSQLVKMRLNTLSLFQEKKETLHAQTNPIYLYGQEGTGKTHLLMSIAHKLRSVGYNALYIRAEAFTEHLVRAIRAGEMISFRSLYRRADILLIDDIHTFSRKTATQEEFFHTFNTLHTAGKQIIIAAQTSPQFLQFIEPRLISRFEWGIVLELHPLQNSDVISLLEKKALQLHLSLSRRVCEFLADSFSHNPKIAVQALHTIALRSHLTSKNKHLRVAFTIPVIKSLLTDLIEAEKKRALNVEKIIRNVASYHGITYEDIIGKSQARECVIPRQISMYLCRKHLKMPFVKIGDAFSRDHSTVMSAIDQLKKKLQENDTASIIQAIELQL